MIALMNATPEMEEFKSLMRRADDFLNKDAARRSDYYKARGGNPLEDDVKRALDECAKGTAFENKIEKISGQKFPDIVAARFYGVEVKSTKEDHWTSTGSSILESSRVQGVERIYMTFGKLGGTVRFWSRPYEECLCGIAVTHMPRYLIDMRLGAGETIFDKMGVPYDTLRKMDNPVAPVSQYYRRSLRPGEHLWWTGDSVDESVSVKLRPWKTLSATEKRKFTVYGFVNYPQVFIGDYDEYAFWLTMSQGVVNPNVRDQFSAGGHIDIIMADGSKKPFPKVYQRAASNYQAIIRRMRQRDPAVWEQEPELDDVELNCRLSQWMKSVSRYVQRKNKISYDESMEALEILFRKENTI